MTNDRQLTHRARDPDKILIGTAKSANGYLLTRRRHTTRTHGALKIRFYRVETAMLLIEEFSCLEQAYTASRLGT